MNDWRDYILKHFQTPSHRLTLVADPDELMLEEWLLVTIHANGFQLLRFDDSVQFRYAYESQFRQKWDQGEDTDLVVVLRSSGHDLQRLPYDLLQRGRQLKFQLFDLFPRLSYPVIRELDRSDLDALFAACQDNPAEELGDQGTRVYVLQHVFGVSPGSLHTAADALKLLLNRHYKGQRVPPALDKLLVERMRQIPGVESWPLARLMADRSAFFEFVQRAWPRFLSDFRSSIRGVQESGIVYEADAPNLPLNDPDIRVFVDSLFLEGYLKPIPAPDDWPTDGWLQVGILKQPAVDRQIRFERLAKLVRDQLPDSSATFQVWVKFAQVWAELLTVRYRLDAASPLPAAVSFAALQLQVEQSFAQWMLARYLALHNYPPLPAPVMVHHVSHFLASQRQAGVFKRVALVVVDGMALDQWLLVREQLRDSEQGWSFVENTVFAWVPTLTPVSRQSIFAAWPPLNFPTTWRRTDREPAHWERFWTDAGLAPQAIGYFKGANLDADVDLDAWLTDSRSMVAGLVLNRVDDIMHGMQLGTAGMHQQVQLWVEQGNLPRLLKKLYQAGFAVFITSDHGNVAATGMGKPQQGALVETYGKRALQFSQPAFLQQAQTQYPAAIAWRSDALPEDVHVLLADGLNAFHLQGEEVVCHGGIALEEVIVPFIHVTGVPA